MQIHRRSQLRLSAAAKTSPIQRAIKKALEKGLILPGPGPSRQASKESCGDAHGDAGLGAEARS